MPVPRDRRHVRRRRLHAQERHDRPGQSPSSRSRPRGAGRARARGPTRRSSSRRATPAIDALNIDPLELSIGFGLVPLVDQKAGGSLLSRVSAIRRQIASPSSAWSSRRCGSTTRSGLDSHEYIIKVRGAEVARGRTMAGHQLAMDPGDAVGQLPGHRHHRARVRPARHLDRRRLSAPRPRRSATRSSTRSR